MHDNYMVYVMIVMLLTTVRVMIMTTVSVEERYDVDDNGDEDVDGDHNAYKVNHEYCVCYIDDLFILLS